MNGWQMREPLEGKGSKGLRSLSRLNMYSVTTGIGRASDLQGNSS